MFSAMSCSALVMKRLTPSMCQVPSGCSMALVRPAPTSDPASGSVSTIVAPHCRSMACLANRFCSSVPITCSTWEKAGPLEYIQMAGLEPRTISASAQATVRGTPGPPSSSGRSRLVHPASLKVS